MRIKGTEYWLRKILIENGKPTDKQYVSFAPPNSPEEQMNYEIACYFASKQIEQKLVA